MTNKIQGFIDDLSKIENESNFTNLYFGNSNETEIRKQNLKSYLTLISENNSRILLLGEAPGHKGCKNTGIAFTCESTIKTHPYFSNKNFSTINEMNFEREVSASIVWSELTNAQKYPLIWNIFPFHPHKNNNTNSNRTPNSKELKIGLEYTKQLIEIFDIQNVICIGKKSYNTIQNDNVDIKYVRHPSMGGANIFREQIKLLLK